MRHEMDGVDATFLNAFLNNYAFFDNPVFIGTNGVPCMSTVYVIYDPKALRERYFQCMDKHSVFDTPSHMQDIYNNNSHRKHSNSTEFAYSMFAKMRRTVNTCPSVDFFGTSVQPARNNWFGATVQFNCNKNIPTPSAACMDLFRIHVDMTYDTMSLRHFLTDKPFSLVVCLPVKKHTDAHLDANMICTYTEI